MIYYDKCNNRLVYIRSRADENFWDAHWNSLGAEKRVKKINRMVLAKTRNFLIPPSRVIDAGCGLAHTVYSLHCTGYEAYGIDFAEKTVALVKSVAPELNVSIGDVRLMNQFADNFFDGYWSLGVIEHFFDGYDSIVREAFRIIRPGGYAFVTVPTMSPLRSLKVKLHLYPNFEGNSAEDFYQFALSAKDVIENFEKAGFVLVSTSALGGFKGLKDELKPLTKVLQKIYNNKKNLLLKILLVAVDKLCSGFAGHTRLYVFRKPSI